MDPTEQYLALAKDQHIQAIHNLNAIVADQNAKIVDLNAKIVELRQDIAAKNNVIDEQDRTMTIMQRTNHDQQRQLDDQANRINQLERQMAAMFNVPNCVGCNCQMTLHQLNFVCWNCRYVCKDPIQSYSRILIKSPRVVLSKSHKM